MIIDITEVSQLEALRDLPKALLYFTADWCGPCKQMRPTLEAFSRTLSYLPIYRVNIDGEGLQEVAPQHGIRGIPTIIAFAEGKETSRQSGSCDAEKLKLLVASTEF
jgi:thioredoxin-like negative regulator of GroEL